MKRDLLVGCLASVLMLSSCELLETIDNGLSTEEVTNGLKTALAVGADTSVNVTGKEGGFFKDAAIKILLPEEASVIYSYVNNPLSDFIGLSDAVDDFEKSVNRAAEKAVPKATDIIKGAITDLTITDAMSILNGTNPLDSKKAGGFDSTAATAYLKAMTRSALIAAFKPPIDEQLDKDLGFNISANESWLALQTANSALGTVGLNPVDNLDDVDLSTYATGKAIDGLFVKIGDTEREIRRDPYKWIADTVGDILIKIFGKD